MDTPELSFRFDAVDINKKSDIIQALLTHYFVHMIRSELEQLKNGLSMLGVLDLLHSHPSLLKPLFLAGDKPHMTCDHIIKLFCVCWCPSGSNHREVEESVILGWTEYIHGIKGNCGVGNIMCLVIIINPGNCLQYTI